MHAYLTPFRRLESATAAGSLLLTVLGILSFLAGSLSNGAQGSVLGLCLIFTVPACLLFCFSMSRVKIGDLLGAVILSVIGGFIMVAAAIAAAIAAAYANPCFEIAKCMRGPTFAYLSLIAAIIAFLLTGALGLFISPAAMGIAAHRRGART
jgi:hypothetical protein